MNVQRAALMSFHACPLAAPGQGKAGGMNVYVRQLAAALGQQGVEVDVFTRSHSDAVNPIEQIGHNSRVIHLPGGAPDAPMGTLFDSLPEFLAEVKSFQEQNGLEYQVVHSHYWLSGWVGRQLARSWGLPHVLTFHTLSLIKMQSRVGETEPPARQTTETELVTSAGRIVAFSPHERDALVRLYGADSDRIILAPCGVDLSLFRPLDPEMARQRLGLNGEKVVLFVGRVEPLKGLDLLLQTAVHMETRENLKVLVVGGIEDGDPEVSRLQQAARELEVDQVFEFVGRVDQEELPFYYSAANVCVMPSFYESFGMAALEAMACGTPVVASRVGGLSTVIHHGHTGFLKSWRCPEAFANSLDMIISNEDLQASMGRAARGRAEGMSWKSVAGRMIDVYRYALPETP